jgi:hypothetical protein
MTTHRERERERERKKTCEDVCLQSTAKQLMRRDTARARESARELQEARFGKFRDRRHRIEKDVVRSFLSFLLSGLELSDATIYELQIRTLLGTAPHFC